MASRFALRRPQNNGASPTPHAGGAQSGGRGGPGGSGGGAGGAAGELAEAAAEMAGGAARGGSKSGPGIMSKLLGSLASQALSWGAIKTLGSAALAYMSFKMLVGFKDDIVNGTPFQTGPKPAGGVPPDRLAAAAAGSQRSAAGVGPAVPAQAATVAPVLDPRVRESMQTVAGRDALEMSKRADAALDGKSDASRMVYSDGRMPVPGPEKPVLDANRASLGLNDNAGVVRLTVPGGDGKTVDFLAKDAVNDRAALKEFQEAYPKLARENGLPAQLPPGASVIVGQSDPFHENFQSSSPREYRFVQDDTFQKNAKFDGSMHTPGGKSFAGALGYQDGSRPFDLTEIRQGDPNLVRAASVEDQARQSSLIVQREAYVGQMSNAVSAPVSTLDGFLGRSSGSAMNDMATSIGGRPGETMLVQSVDLESQKRATGVVTRQGSAVIGSGPDGDFVSMAHRGADGVSTNVEMKTAKGGLGNFDPGGQFVGTDAASKAMANVSNAMDNRADSPVLASVRSAGVRGEKELNIDLTPGKESSLTRVHYGDRVVDYGARNGQMTMIERDPQTNEVREAAMIRSRDIKVDPQGHVSMDPESRKVLDDHVKTYAAGRSGAEFSQTHPVEATQFASLKDALPVQPNVAVAQAPAPSVAAVASAEPARVALPLDVESTGTASAVREAGIRESNTPPNVVETATPGERRMASARGLGE